ncbi:MAG: TolC family protein [Campylobacterales bacterium]|nr:TolC family protein [Campylobacterales bacterium]
MHIIRYSLVLFFATPQLFGALLSFDEAVTQFLNHNYDLKIASQEADKSTADLMTAELRPNPTISASYINLDLRHNLNSTSDSSQTTLHVDYPIELGGKRGRRIESAKENIAYAKDLLKETKREQLFTLVNAYYQVQADETNLINSIANRHDFEVLLTIAQSKYEHGFLSEIDLKKLQLQIIDYDKEVELNKAILSSDKENLAFLLSMNIKDVALSPIALPQTFLESEDELILYAQQNRSDCLAAQQNIHVSTASVELEKANAIPNISVGVETESIAPQRDPLMGVGVTIPLPIYDRNQGAIEKSRITALQASTQLSKTLEQAKSEVKQSFIQYQAQRSIYNSIQNGYELAKNLKEKQEKIFSIKGISILELLDAQKSYRDYQKNLTQALIDQHVVLARLKLNSGLLLNNSKEY